MGPIRWIQNRLAGSMVDRGVRLLDARVPDWPTRVNVQLLDIGSCSRCVLGQVYRSERRWPYGFNTGRRALFGHRWWPVITHGFMPIQIQVRGRDVISAEILTARWTQAVLARQALIAAVNALPTTAQQPTGYTVGTQTAITAVTWTGTVCL